MYRGPIGMYRGPIGMYRGPNSKRQYITRKDRTKLENTILLSERL